MSEMKLYTLKSFEGIAVSKADQQERKRHFFEWLEQPDNSKTPKTITACESVLNVSHPTIIKWHKEWKNLVRLGMRTRVKVSPEEVTKLLTKRLEVVKPYIEKTQEAGKDPVAFLRDTVELGLWYGTAKITEKLDSMLDMILIPDQAVELLSTLISTLDKMEQMSIRRSGTIKTQIKEETLTNTYGDLVAGMILPPSGRPGEPPIEIPGEAPKALPNDKPDSEPIEGESVPTPELIEEDPPTEEDTPPEDKDEPPTDVDMPGIEV